LQDAGLLRAATSAMIALFVWALACGIKRFFNVVRDTEIYSSHYGLLVVEYFGKLSALGIKTAMPHGVDSFSCCFTGFNVC
jgi:hypothetical protein